MIIANHNRAIIWLIVGTVVAVSMSLFIRSKNPLKSPENVILKHEIEQGENDLVAVRKIRTAKRNQIDSLLTQIKYPIINNDRIKDIRDSIYSVPDSLYWPVTE